MSMLNNPMILCPSLIWTMCASSPNLYTVLNKLHTLGFFGLPHFLSKLGFRGSKSDTSLFILHHGNSITYLLLYVDDIILTASTTTLLHNIIHQLHFEFAITDLDHLQHFLGISVQRTHDGLFLSQHQYAYELLDLAHMSHCNPCLTLDDTKFKPSLSDDNPLANPTEYRSITGALQYLTLIRPDIFFAVKQACLFMHSPTDRHLHLVKQIL
jgi:hypothetical protein